MGRSLCQGTWAQRPRLEETGCQAAYSKHSAKALPTDSQALSLWCQLQHITHTNTNLAHIKGAVQWVELIWPQH